jgi:hypothetical protein
MRKTWVRPPRGVLGLGSFPPAKWSVYSATLLSEPRTNNRVEGWHLKINMFLKVTHPGIYQFNYDLKKFFRMEEDRRRQAKTALLFQQSNAIAQGIAIPPSPLNYFTRRSADLKALCIDYQNDLYVTSPRRTGYIRFLSNIATVLMRRPPNAGGI